MSLPPPPANVPRTFTQYLRSFGPGLVVVLTWLGAGDIVDMAIAGGSYGYSLMWVLVFAVFMRYLFVSRIAWYQLCNERQEGVLDGLVRLHRWYAPGLFIGALIIGHIDGAYMSVGCAEVCRNLFQVGETWQWALLINGVVLCLVLRPAYASLEFFFKVLLGVLSFSFVGTAIWVGVNPEGIFLGLVRFEMPGQVGHFNPLLVAVAMIGAVGGSFMNLVYPYFLEAKGWRGPQFRRVQTYDFLLGIGVMVVLNLAVWTLGAELLFPDKHITTLEDLPNLLSTVLGQGGRILFYIGIFAALFMSNTGHASGLGRIASHAWIRCREKGPLPRIDFAQHPAYKWVAIWCVVSPLVWSLPGMPDFVTLTLVANSAKVVMLPALAGGIWWITASPRFIGKSHANRWWDNLVMAVLFVLAMYGTVVSVQSVWGWFINYTR